MNLGKLRSILVGMDENIPTNVNGVDIFEDCLEVNKLNVLKVSHLSTEDAVVTLINNRYYSQLDAYPQYLVLWGYLKTKGVFNESPGLRNFVFSELENPFGIRDLSFLGTSSLGRSNYEGDLDVYWMAISSMWVELVKNIKK